MSEELSSRRVTELQMNGRLPLENPLDIRFSQKGMRGQNNSYFP